MGATVGQQAAVFSVDGILALLIVITFGCLMSSGMRSKFFGVTTGFMWLLIASATALLTLAGLVLTPHQEPIDSAYLAVPLIALFGVKIVYEATEALMNFANKSAWRSANEYVMRASADFLFFLGLQLGMGWNLGWVGSDYSDIVVALRSSAFGLAAIMYCMYALQACSDETASGKPVSYYLDCRCGFRNENSLTEVYFVALTLGATGILWSIYEETTDKSFALVAVPLYVFGAFFVVMPLINFMRPALADQPSPRVWFNNTVLGALIITTVAMAHMLVSTIDDNHNTFFAVMIAVGAAAIVDVILGTTWSQYSASGPYKSSGSTV